LGGASWIVGQLFLSIKNKNKGGLSYLIKAAVLGGLGFFAMAFNSLNEKLCDIFSCNFSGDFLWFLVTPICLHLVFKYYQESHNRKSIQ
jgi:hypothetical protein